MCSSNALAQSAQCAPGANCSNQQSGGDSYGTVNVYGRPQFQLTNDIISDTIKHLPPGIPVTVAAIEGPHAWQMGKALADAIRAAGYSVILETHLMAGTVEPISISTKDPNNTLVVFNPAAYGS
jgi:hypothetical protein